MRHISDSLGFTDVTEETLAALAKSSDSRLLDCVARHPQTSEDILFYLARKHGRALTDALLVNERSSARVIRVICLKGALTTYQWRLLSYHKNTPADILESITERYMAGAFPYGTSPEELCDILRHVVNHRNVSEKVFEIIILGNMERDVATIGPFELDVYAVSVAVSSPLCPDHLICAVPFTDKASDWIMKEVSDRMAVMRETDENRREN